jgi:hypothetical protein
MSGKSALIRQRDLKQAIMAAQKAGAQEVQLRLGGGVSVVIPLHAADGSDISPPADSNNSFDKIMRKPGAV